jgi:hypothetical protein
MKLQGWLVAILLLIGAVLLYRSCAASKPPDQQLADHFSSMCDIARRGIDAPERGIRELGRYLGEHTGDILGSFGDTIAAIEKIEDDADHDDRARVARDRLGPPLSSCADDWERFADAVESDRDAYRVLTRALARLDRTLEILLPSTRVEFRALPRQLGDALGWKLGTR